ncbi:hypothetical protein CDEST_13800 [Colletotrichum destructivum]|uniref:Uncharacterized protein n=1 Tax=Colletotrichum destructivum TaxID=34406 RepID=A0AAX4J023_9PEZI|nr:hypothetical protein CDEST_13800 [Colletotrichum destructivum]
MIVRQLRDVRSTTVSQPLSHSDFSKRTCLPVTFFRFSPPSLPLVPSKSRRERDFLLELKMTEDLSSPYLPPFRHRRGICAVAVRDSSKGLTANELQPCPARPFSDRPDAKSDTHQSGSSLKRIVD